MGTRHRIRIGISGWTYARWRGRFYPKGLPHRAELEYASRQFDTIEINGTFYSLQKPDSFARWDAQTPPGFVFAVKGPRYITHMLRLRKVETPLANFLASGLLRLGPKLGPILWQFPASFAFDHDLFDRFLGLLPRDTDGALAIAQRHDQRLAGRAWLKADATRPIRHAVEVRHESFRDPTFIALLRRHGVALVVADAVDWPCLMDVTADFVYVRLHGSEELFASGYDDAALDRWAARIAAWAAGRQAPEATLIAAAPKSRRARDVHVYFDNDAKVRAPGDAAGLARRLGLDWKPDGT